jgi:hypothetical protein
MIIHIPTRSKVNLESNAPLGRVVVVRHSSNSIRTSPAEIDGEISKVKQRQLEKKTQLQTFQKELRQRIKDFFTRRRLIYSQNQHKKPKKEYYPSKYTLE